MADKPCKTIPEVLSQLQKLQDQRVFDFFKVFY